MSQNSGDDNNDDNDNGDHKYEVLSMLALWRFVDLTDTWGE